MEKSESIELIAQALLKAQNQFMTASKDAKNPFFKSKYATLNSVWEAVEKALHDNGLSCLQPIKGNMVQTVILHTSGQYISSECPIICAKEKDPQALGSAITYARRYALASMLGVMTDDDDDAEKAMNRPQAKPVANTAKVEMITQDQKTLFLELGVNIPAICEYLKIDSIDKLTKSQAEQIIQKKLNAGK